MLCVRLQKKFCQMNGQNVQSLVSQRQSNNGLRNHVFTSKFVLCLKKNLLTIFLIKRRSLNCSMTTTKGTAHTDVKSGLSTPSLFGTSCSLLITKILLRNTN